MQNARRKTDVLTTDVLVIGGGGAALRAALAADEAGAGVLIATKGHAGKSGATYCSVAEIGAFNVPDAAIDPEDSPEIFYQDIMDAAQGMADPELARLVADEAVDAKAYLERCGLAFARNHDGSYLGYRACFSSRARSHVVENHFKPLVAALMRRIRKRKLTLLEDVTITGLLVADNLCRGALGLKDGKLVILRAKSVVLAAGGASTLFRRNLYPGDITGDGYAMAWRAGARMANMEFIQAGIGLAWPEANLFGNQLWEAMPRLTNAKGERFLARHIPGGCSEEAAIRAKGGHFPFSVRDISRFVEIGVQQELAEGSPTERGNVYLDFLEVDFEAVFAREGGRLRDVWPLTCRRFKELGVDVYRDKLEIACFAHAINGGIVIDAHGASSVEGLYAAGEVAAGPHGADRLGGNMSLACQIFGRRAGEAAAARAQSLSQPPPLGNLVEEHRAWLYGFGSLSAREADTLLAALQQAADKALLIVRDREKLERFLETLGDLEERLAGGCAKDAVPLARRVALRNLIDVGRLIARAALLRQESRGSHYRSDYPGTDPACAAPLVFALGQCSKL